MLLKVIKNSEWNPGAVACVLAAAACLWRFANGEDVMLAWAAVPVFLALVTGVTRVKVKDDEGSRKWR
jgi:hypothetical protein